MLKNQFYIFSGLKKEQGTCNRTQLLEDIKREFSGYFLYNLAVQIIIQSFLLFLNRKIFNLQKKVIDIVKIPHCNQPLRSYHLLNFGITSKIIQNYLKRILKYSTFFQLHIWNFLHKFQPKQHFAADLNAEADMRIQLSSIKPYLKEICKSIEQCYSHYFFFCKIQLFSKVVIFFIKMLFILTCNGFIMVILNILKL